MFARRCVYVRNRPQPSARSAAVPMVSSQKISLLEVSHVALLRFVWQAWHFVTFRRVWLRVENTFATFSEDALQFSWHAQRFGRVHRHFASQPQHFRRVALRVFCQGCVKWRHCKFRGILWDVMRIDGSLARNIDFEVANFQVLRKTGRKTSILKLHSVKIGGSLARNVGFDAPTCLVSSLWFSCGLAVSMGEAAKPLLFEGFQAGCHVFLRGRRGTL